MSDYKKYRESHLKAQKKYDDKNREKNANMTNKDGNKLKKIKK